MAKKSKIRRMIMEKRVSNSVVDDKRPYNADDTG